MAEKFRYWTASLYPESMVENWIDLIETKLQLPCCWIIHDRDFVHEVEEDRKIHVHLIVAWDGPTTHKNADRAFQLFRASGHARCSGPVEPVNHIATLYKYMIHDTQAARDAGKYLYDPSDRHCSNGFDIGSYIQITQAEKMDILERMCNFVIDNEICNFADFYSAAYVAFSEEWSAARAVISGYSSLIDRVIKGVYHRKRPIDKYLNPDPDPDSM